MNEDRYPDGIDSTECDDLRRLKREIKRLRLKDILTDEAKAFLPFALGQKAVLVSEAEEARGLERVETARDATLKLRYSTDRAEFQQALVVARTQLPPDSVAREGLLMWVRTSLIEAGAKEDDVAKLKQLKDLAEPHVDTWLSKQYRETVRQGYEDGLAKGLEEARREAEARAWQDHRATLVGQARRKFGVKTAKALATVLESVSSPERLAEVANLIIDCMNGEELLSRAAETS